MKLKTYTKLEISEGGDYVPVSVPRYNIQELPPLTEAQLRDLARKQAARDAIVG